MRDPSRQVGALIVSQPPAFAITKPNCYNSFSKPPIRSLNGDLYPVNVNANRSLYRDFDVVILPHTGHYPMLECALEFNRRLSTILDAMGHSAPSQQ
jgi:hypothetical protein